MLHVGPNVGPAPVVEVIARANRRVDMNVYDFTSRAVVQAMQKACQRGVKFRVMIADNPYHAQGLYKKESAALAKTCAETKKPPSRFSKKYVFDHAKYIVADSKTNPMAVVSTANFTYSGFHKNREYFWTGTSPELTGALQAVFDADWNRNRVGRKVRQTLVVSPGAGQQLKSVINQRGPVVLEQEELAGPKGLLNALANKGRKAKIILPSSINRHDRKKARKLLASGVKIRLIKKPFMHAKMILGSKYAFIGSQNLSSSSIKKNREIGVIFRATKPMRKLLKAFKLDWASAKPFRAK